MEEDIKILETKLNEYHTNIFGNRFLIIYEKDIQALENLIKGYRRLEAKVKRYKKYLDNKDKKFEEALEYEYQERETDYIPKSKIRKNIEELNNYDSEFSQRVLNHSEHTLTEFVQNILQEFLEEE